MYKDGNFRALNWYLLESTVDSVWTADVKAQEHGIRVAVTKWPHIVIVRRTCNEKHEKKKKNIKNHRTKYHGQLKTWSQR